jgi:GTP-binding protein EngB required for normal cell division
LRNHGLQSIDKTNNLEKQDSQVIDIAQTIDADHKVILVKTNKIIQRPTKSLMVVEASAEASTQGLLQAMIPSLECY